MIEIFLSANKKPKRYLQRQIDMLFEHIYHNVMPNGQMSKDIVASFSNHDLVQMSEHVVGKY